jgi:acylphosphatase
MDVRVHILVSGIVQGVGFRFFVYDRAVNYNLRGYVRNLSNGQVEIEAEGDRSILEEFIKEIKVGPRSSHVADLNIQWIKSLNSISGFVIQ